MSQEHIKNFLDVFKQIEKKVNTYLLDPINITSANEELQRLSKHVSEHSSISSSDSKVPNYELQKAQKAISEFQTKISNLRESSQPKTKFKFSRKERNPNPVAKIPSETAVDQVDSPNTSQSLSNPTISGLKGQNIILNSADSLNKELWFDNLENCSILISSIPSALHMTQLKSCKIIGGPVLTSIFLEKCHQSTFVMGCQQLRIHTSSNCDFYLHVRGRAIIEDCKCCRFAPYNRVYDSKEEDFANSQLDVDENNWDQIGDFNWLSTEPSPNWTILPENERIDNWTI